MACPKVILRAKGRLTKKCGGRDLKKKGNLVPNLKGAGWFKKRDVGNSRIDRARERICIDLERQVAGFKGILRRKRERNCAAPGVEKKGRERKEEGLRVKSKKAKGLASAHGRPLKRGGCKGRTFGKKKGSIRSGG